MKTPSYTRFPYIFLVFSLFLFIVPFQNIEAQRINRGGRPQMSRPAARPAPSRPSRNVNTRNMSRPTNRSINGGAVKTRNTKMPSRDVSRDRKLDRSEIKKPPTTRPATGRETVNRDRPGDRNPSDRNPGDRNPGDRNPGNRNPGDRNNINIDKGKNNVNINIDNSRDINIRNTRVRSSGRIYVRPPYIFGGFGFYAFRPYYYHPFRPFYWGPYWHPWGYFVTSLATTAIIISIENQRYHYDQGVYYIEEDDGYRVVQAPVGAEIKKLPEGSQTVEVNETTNNYYYGGTYYEKDGEMYKVVPPTAGTIVPNLPEGAEEVRVGDQTFVKYGETYYQPVQVDGKNMYEVVEVKEES